MEKSTAHYRLDDVRRLIDEGMARATKSAFETAREVQIFCLDDMLKIVCKLSSRDLHKSMTTFADHRVWQDVYHGQTDAGLAVYIKLTIADGLLIVSFKEL